MKNKRFGYLSIIALTALLILLLNNNEIILGYLFGRPENRMKEIKMINGLVYLKDYRVGLLSVNKVLSSNSKPDQEPDEKTEFIFNTDLDIFYQVSNDTLFLFVRKKTTVPYDFPKEINIKQIELKNPDYMNLYNTYVEKGYKIF
ncbi:MAG: hypothetical protein OEX22_11760 [Cyclobacteriaceae bacterium]|nr:hypothetical protein [Cyclobacteriaceae bacterium]